MKTLHENIPTFLLLIGSLFLFSCRSTRQPTPPTQVVLVVLDTLRLDALGCYGNPRNPTPRMDAIAREGIRFDQAISSSSWTLPAVASLLTGTWPTLHGARGKGVTLTPIRDEIPTAAEIFRKQGFNTLGFANAAFLSPTLHVDRGFDLFDHRHAYNWNARRADETLDVALEHLGRHAQESNFVLIHFFDPHLEYDPPPGYVTRYTGGRTDPPPPLTLDICQAMQRNDGRDPPSPEDIQYIQDVYLGEVSFLDAQVGRLVDELARLGIYEDTILILVSDHGEEFWEHRGFEHGHTLYDELIRVPLILKLPVRIPASRSVIEEQIRVLDVLPTVFDLLEMEKPSTFLGESLMPNIRGEAGQNRLAFSESTLYRDNRISLRNSQYKYILSLDKNPSAEDEMYDWRADPEERRNLVGRDPEQAARMKEELLKFYEDLLNQSDHLSSLPIVDMSPEHIEELKSLGYIR